ncbi:MAG: hypothetical protein BMS9Abin08_0628 [Gammaproteobacteria bacterium]|nr:MAG: hypothetical protein BMS9Abin08_0628 [Gammaproteobacteria bacterium]
MDTAIEKLVEENKEYYECLEKSLRGLFDKARDTNELQFSFSLSEPRLNNVHFSSFPMVAVIVLVVVSWASFLSVVLFS